MNPSPCTPPPPVSTPASLTAPPPLRSEELLGGEREVLIVHGDQQYRLRHTRNDKLILTK